MDIYIRFTQKAKQPILDTKPGAGSLSFILRKVGCDPGYTPERWKIGLEKLGERERVMSRISRKFYRQPTFCTFICDMTWAYYTEKVGSFFLLFFKSSEFYLLVLCISFVFFFGEGGDIVLYGRFKGGRFGLCYFYSSLTGATCIFIFPFPFRFLVCGFCVSSLFLVQRARKPGKARRERCRYSSFIFTNRGFPSFFPFICFRRIFIGEK